MKKDAWLIQFPMRLYILSHIVVVSRRGTMSVGRVESERKSMSGLRMTVLKRLCDRGLFQNQNGTVTSLISQKEFYARHSELYVEEAFGGSLPAFLAAFGTRKKLTDKEVDEIRKIIDSMRS